MIGDEINVVILGIRGNQVRLGVNAPVSVPVHRQEIFEKIATAAAAKPATGR
jgi:carbon storage regulator